MTPGRPRFYTQEKPAATLKDALAGFLKAEGLGRAAKHTQIQGAWERVVGAEFCGHTRVLGFRKGTVEIGADSSALMNEIRFHRAALLESLQREIARPAITGISFSLVPTQERNEGSSET